MPDRLLLLVDRVADGTGRPSRASASRTDVVLQRRSFVSQLRIDDISEIYQIRTPLECMAASVAAETIDDAALAVLDRLDANHEFHRTVIACARSRWLQTLIG